METALIITLLQVAGQLAAAKIASDQTSAAERQQLLATMQAGSEKAAQAHQAFVLAANGVGEGHEGGHG